MTRNTHYSQGVSTPSTPIPAEHLPLAFHPAPGWPTPTLEWVTTHLGWQPPPGWVPLPGCPHSPPRWQFWSRNDSGWARMARPHLRAGRRNVRAGTVLMLLAVGLLIFGLVDGVDVIRMILGALLLSTVWFKVAQARADMRRIEAALLTAVVDTAAQLKLQSDRAHYERYLRSSGGH
nr:hypothetical protein BJQ95_00019 [Cryobacterium sp. SO1]